MCDACLDELARGLRDLLPTPGDRFEVVLRSAGWCAWPRRRELVPGLWDDLAGLIAADRGIDYAALGAGGGSGGERGVVETGIVLHERAVEIASDLRRALRALVVVCRDARVVHTAPAEQRLTSSRLVPAMVEWLLWRVDGIAWHAEAAEVAQRVHDAVEQVRWVIDRPPHRQQLGACPVEGCVGHLSATPGAVFARCDWARHAVEAQPLRDAAVAEGSDWLLTAAETADVATGLVLTAVRPEQVRQRVHDRIRQWAHRGRIEARGHTPDGAPLYRFGDVYALLLQDEARTNNDSKGA